MSFSQPTGLPTFNLLGGYVNAVVPIISRHIDDGFKVINLYSKFSFIEMSGELTLEQQTSVEIIEFDFLVKVDARWIRLYDTYPKEMFLNETQVFVLLHSYGLFLEYSKNQYDLNRYAVDIEIDNFSTIISYYPLTDVFIDDIPFEISNRGVYKYGMGYLFHYQNKEFLKVTGMR